MPLLDYGISLTTFIFNFLYEMRHNQWKIWLHVGTLYFAKKTVLAKKGGRKDPPVEEKYNWSFLIATSSKARHNPTYSKCKTFLIPRVQALHRIILCIEIIPLNSRHIHTSPDPSGGLPSPSYALTSQQLPDAPRALQVPLSLDQISPLSLNWQISSLL